MAKFKLLIHEAHRRSLWQVLAIYLAGSFGALQVVELVSNNVGLPGWVTPFAVVLLVIGFPIVMATAFVQEGGPVSLSQATSPPPPSVPAETPRPGPTPAHAADEPESEFRQAVRFSGTGPHHRLFTWRNAMLGGVGAFALLGVSTAGFMTMRSLGLGPVGTLVAQGVLTDRASLVIADLESTTNDTLLARAATEALRVDLAQSPNVRVLEARQVALVLQRMQRSPEAALDESLATEVAVREGAAAIVAGEINGVGRGFVLTARLLASGDGETLVSLRENASDSSDVIAAIDQLSKKLRERIGESYKSLRRGQPLDRVTTASLEALRKYSQGARAIDVEGNEQRGIALLEEAVALDTAFAMAYRKLGITLGNLFIERARALDAITRAYNHRDRLSPRERYLAEASYFSTVAIDTDAAVRAYQNMLEVDSADAYALNNIGVMYSRMGDWARSEQYYLRAIRADSTNGLSYTNVIESMVRLGKFDDAFAMLDNFSRRFPGNPRRFEFRSLLVSSMGDYEEAVRLLNTMKDSGQSNPGVAIDANEHLADVAATRGQLGEARRYLSENIARNDERRLASQSLPLSIDIAQLDIHVRRQPAEGTARIEEALRRYPLDGMAPADRPYVQLIGAFAEAGQPDRARHFLEEYDTQVHPELRAWNERIMLNDGRAALALAEGRLNPAIDTARLAAASGCPRCPLLTLGRALEAAGQQDSAIAVYERYVSEPSLRRTALLDRWHLGWILERLGELHEQRGNVQKAAQYYGQFVELWKDADSELQPRVNAARNRLQRIVGPRG